MLSDPADHRGGDDTLPGIAAVGQVASGVYQDAADAAAPVAAAAAEVAGEVADERVGPRDLGRWRTAVVRAASRAFIAPVERSAVVAATRVAPLGSRVRAHGIGSAIAVAAGAVESAGELAAVVQAGTGPGATLAPPTAAAAAATAVTAQLAQFYLACGVIGYELGRNGLVASRSAVMAALAETYVGASGRLAPGRAGKLVAARLAGRVGANLFPVVGIARGAYQANDDLRRARRAARGAAPGSG